MLEDRGDALEVLLDDLGLVLLVTVRTDVHGHEVHVTPRCGWGGRRRRRSRGGLGSRGAVHGGGGGGIVLRGREAKKHA